MKKDVLKGTSCHDMELDEISLVTRGANQTADVLISKGSKKMKSACNADHTKLGDGQKCRFCDVEGKHAHAKVKKVHTVESVRSGR